jgi:hypothetical protein
MAEAVAKYPREWEAKMADHTGMVARKSGMAVWGL